MSTYAVRYTQPLLGAANAAGYLVAVPGVSVLIRQNGAECDVFADNVKTPMDNPVPTGVPPGTAGVDTTGNLTVYLEPGRGYSAVATVGATSTTFAIPDISLDPLEPIPEDAVSEAMLAFGVATQAELDAEAAARAAAVAAEAVARAAAISGLSGTYVAYVTGLVGDGVAVDRAPIQAKLSFAPAGGTVNVPFVGDGIMLIDEPLVFPPGGKVHLHLEPGVVIRLAPGSNCNMVKNSAVSTTAWGAIDAAVDDGDTAVTSAAFTAPRTGQPFTLWGAGTAGAPMSGTVTGAGTGTLSAPAVLAVADGYVAVGPRDTDITLSGGTWDLGAQSIAGIDNYISLFRRLDGLTIRHTSFISTNAGNACYAISPGDVTDVFIDDIEFDVARDGVHFEGPCIRAKVSNLRGNTGDDYVAATIKNYPLYDDTRGPIEDLQVDGIAFDGSTGGLSLLGDSPLFKFKRITFANLTGSVEGNAIRITNDDVMVSTLVEGLTISHVNVTNGNSLSPVISLGATLIRDIRLEDVVHNDNLILLEVKAGSVVNTLTIAGLRSLSGTQADNIIAISGQVDDLILSGVSTVLGGNARLIGQLAGSVVSRISINDFRIRGVAASSGYVLVQGVGVPECRIMLANGMLKQLAYGFFILGTATVYLDNVEADTIFNYTFHVGAAGVLRVEAGVLRHVNNGDRSLFIVSGGVAAVTGRSFRVNMNLLTPATWDIIYDTDTFPAGPKQWNGSAWVAA